MENDFQNLLHQLRLTKVNMVSPSRQYAALGLTHTSMSMQKFDRSDVPAELASKVCEAYNLSPSEYEHIFDLATGVAPVWEDSSIKLTTFGRLLHVICGNGLVTLQDVAEDVGLPIPYLNRLCLGGRPPAGLATKLKDLYLGGQSGLKQVGAHPAYEPVPLAGRTLMQRLLLWFLQENALAFRSDALDELTHLSKVPNGAAVVSKKSPVYEYFYSVYRKATGRKTVRASFFEELNLTEYAKRKMRAGDGAFTEESLTVLKEKFFSNEYNQAGLDFINYLSGPSCTVLPDFRSVTEQQYKFCSEMIGAIPYMDDETAYSALMEMWDARRVIRAKRRRGKQQPVQQRVTPRTPRTPLFQYFWTLPQIRILKVSEFANKIGINTVTYNRFANGEMDITSESLNLIFETFELDKYEQAIALYFANLSRRMVVFDNFRLPLEHRLLVHELAGCLSKLSVDDAQKIYQSLQRLRAEWAVDE